MGKLLVALALVSGCMIPRSTRSSQPSKPSGDVQPEWNIRATENARDPNYEARVKAAPRRGASEEITLTMQADAMDFFRKSIAHDYIARDIKVAVGQIADAKSTPNVRVELDGGGTHEAPDWFQSMVKTQRQVDVYVRLTFRTVMRDESVRACPGFTKPLLIIMSANWSSAYVRNDHAIAERSFCREGYPADLGEQVPQMRKLLEEVLVHIDTTVRLELPALGEILALTPPHRADWWRPRSSGGGGSFDDD